MSQSRGRMSYHATLMAEEDTSHCLLSVTMPVCLAAVATVVGDRVTRHLSFNSPVLHLLSVSGCSISMPVCLAAVATVAGDSHKTPVIQLSCTAPAQCLWLLHLNAHNTLDTSIPRLRYVLLGSKHHQLLNHCINKYQQL